MTSRATLLTAAAATAVLSFGALPAGAAMPVATPAQATANSNVLLVQDPGAAGQKKSKKSKRQKEIDQSVESGTVPKRYQGNVPKQYHHLIPWAK